MNRERGMALVTTLFVTSVLLLMAAVGAEIGRRAVVFSSALEGRLEAELAAESTLAEVVYRIGTGTGLTRSRHEGETEGTRTLRADGEWWLWGENTRVRISDLSGRLNPLEPLAAGQFSRLLLRKRIDRGRAAAIEAELRDWVEGDLLRHLNGAAPSDYAAAGLPYVPRGDRQLQHLAELKLLRSMDDALYRAVVDDLTLEPVAAVNVAAIPNDVLLALLGRGDSSAPAGPDELATARQWLAVQGSGHPEIALGEVVGSLLRVEILVEHEEGVARRVAVYRFEPLLNSSGVDAGEQAVGTEAVSGRPWSVVRWRQP